MINFVNVRPEHLNFHGYLFGGVLLKWVDEFAWMTASLDFPHCTLVTIAMNDITFKYRVKNGAILRFVIKPYKKGNTSMTYMVDVFADEPGADREVEVFNCRITFVRIDETGKPIPLPEKNQLRSEVD
ncbi:MAG: acyl-CoA thioesterase [Calditerrivibrio sp.]|nr:acyl-CoA thioesterase [Calditerrivibrio sp.]MCA1933435.1 acyl-CoA thioesterase [Calditerrivibrio sp.]MCA1980847.1 acyl-CoA thioesterase [Calditerrivibrio sp.]